MPYRPKRLQRGENPYLKGSKQSGRSFGSPSPGSFSLNDSITSPGDVPFDFAGDPSSQVGKFTTSQGKLTSEPFQDTRKRALGFLWKLGQNTAGDLNQQALAQMGLAAAAEPQAKKFAVDREQAIQQILTEALRDRESSRADIETKALLRRAVDADSLRQQTESAASARKGRAILDSGKTASDFNLPAEASSDPARFAEAMKALHGNFLEQGTNAGVAKSDYERNKARNDAATQAGQAPYAKDFGEITANLDLANARTALYRATDPKFTDAANAYALGQFTDNPANRIFLSPNEIMFGGLQGARSTASGLGQRVVPNEVTVPGVGEYPSTKKREGDKIEYFPPTPPTPHISLEGKANPNPPPPRKDGFGGLFGPAAPGVSQAPPPPVFGLPSLQVQAGNAPVTTNRGQRVVPTNINFASPPAQDSFAFPPQPSFALPPGATETLSERILSGSPASGHESPRVPQGEVDPSSVTLKEFIEFLELRKRGQSPQKP